MNIKLINGLKYPDEYLTRFFFQNKLNTRKGKVLDLGCGNGNNSSLFYQYSWNVHGIDIDNNHIDDANKNFASINKENNDVNTYLFECKDMLDGIKNIHEKFDTILFASSVYYISREKISELFKTLVANDLLNEGASFYLRIRTTFDYRCGKGKLISNNTFEVNYNETGEEGCQLTFFNDENEFLNLVKVYLNIKEVKIFNLIFDNEQSGNIIHNNEKIIWFKYA